MTFTRMEIETEDRIATLWLDRERKLNAFDGVMHEELIDAFDLLEADPGIDVIVVRGRGRAFCSGSDISFTRGLHGREARDYIDLDMRSKNRVAECRKPVIAGVHGYALGGGFELALACDIRIARADAVFAFRELVIGTIPGSGGLQRLPRIVGMGVAKDWSLSGRDITAEEAHLRGLANGVHAEERFDAELRAYAHLIASRSAMATSFAKSAMDPEPAVSGRTLVFHQLASEALHASEEFQRRTGRFDD